MQPIFDLTDKRVLVTGGASGIGLATVNAFARCGATVAINDLPGDKLDKTIEECRSQGYRVIAAIGDIGSQEHAERMVRSAIQDLQGLDYLINNAATPATSSPIAESDFERQDEAFWNKLLHVNLLGPFRCTKAAASALRQSNGAIVNTASASAFGGGGSSSPYCATKAALVALTREWSRALAPNVRVNAIAPSLVESDWMCRFEGTDFDIAADIPLRRQGLPSEYADLILFLAVGATYMTGQTVVADGGASA